MTDEELLSRVNEVIKPFGCIATDLGPDGVGVQGDARVYGPSVFVSFPPHTNNEDISRISNKITNEVPGITRVLMNIVPT